MERSRNYCCNENATILYLFIVVGVCVTVYNKELFSGAMEMQQWVPFAFLPSYKIFSLAVKNNKFKKL
jgi:hypothetical protein